MYQQVYVAKQDIDYQRIVWRENSSQPMRDYRLLRVTHGLASASHLAVKSLQQAALDATNTSKRVVEVVKSDIYMDDLLTGADTHRELILGSHIISDSEFHLFTDASEVAYAAALYCRTQIPDGKVKFVLVVAKTKVTPLKTTSLPRLELCAAHLGAQLVRQVKSSLNLSIGELYAWTDSMVALAWLQSNPSRWAVFVANRVADVQEVLPASHWRHVASEHNPADCASRGITPSQLLLHPLWWNGPPWLREGNSRWLISAQKHTTELELKSKNTVAYLTQTADEWDLFTKYHSFNQLKRITAYLLRFANNSRSTASQSGAGALITGCLTCAEIRSAEVALVKLNKPVPMRGSLARLQPFLDSKGILRLGGRIKNAVLSDEVKHPIILPKNSPFAKVIAAEIHITTLHAGPKLMQAVLQRRFWVAGI
ncbi:uncharacterized protein LOC118751263 [Rhagoletis pomonella]|uniref:uncharacterized protein LOC118751259 n=1 Tax=Rhagoletis pomonella TaxID=28610 RepID=UPI00177C3B76|nr:uncharacterized protein LOC118751259 [Rhagoletis pomonella]XP_036341938.1 uncharacterized protein LOC118751263 [Rhagoletis pomonella]